MRPRQTLPDLWLLTDARNDAALERALRRRGRRLALVYRHYHLERAARRARFDALASLARRRGHVVLLSGDAATARRWGADGFYGPPAAMRRRRAGRLHVTTAHDLAEIGAANRAHADAVMLSPVFATRSHPGAATLGPLRFRLLAARAGMPVIALGGLDADRARRLRWPKWAAIQAFAE